MGKTARNCVAKDAVGEGPWGLACRGLACFDTLDERVDGAESVVELGRGVADEVDAGAQLVCMAYALETRPYPLYFMIASRSVFQGAFTMHSF
jgi:hypothetical protein